MKQHRNNGVDRRPRFSRWLGYVAAASALIVAGFGIAGAANKDPKLDFSKLDLSKLPPAAEKKVDFAKDILPILKKACLDCHAADGPSGELRLDTQEHLLKGGESGRSVIPGKSDKSLLIVYVAGLVKDKEMPPTGTGDPLTKEQIGLLRAWVDQLPKSEKEAADKK